MAGQAAKKLKKAAESGSPKFAIGAAVSWLFFVFATFYREGSIPWISGIFFGAISMFTTSMIIEALSLGVQFDTWFDLYLVTIGSEVLGGLHAFGIYLWFLVPGYLGFMYGKQALDYLQSTTKNS